MDYQQIKDFLESPATKTEAEIETIKAIALVDIAESLGTFLQNRVNDACHHGTVGLCMDCVAYSLDNIGSQITNQVWSSLQGLKGRT